MDKELEKKVEEFCDYAKEKLEDDMEHQAGFAMGVLAVLDLYQKYFKKS